MSWRRCTPSARRPRRSSRTTPATTSSGTAFQRETGDCTSGSPPGAGTAVAIPSTTSGISRWVSASRSGSRDRHAEREPGEPTAAGRAVGIVRQQHGERGKARREEQRRHHRDRPRRRPGRRSLHAEWEGQRDGRQVRRTDRGHQQCTRVVRSGAERECSGEQPAQPGPRWPPPRRHCSARSPARRPPSTRRLPRGPASTPAPARDASGPSRTARSWPWADSACAEGPGLLRTATNLKGRQPPSPGGGRRLTSVACRMVRRRTAA